MNDGIIGTWSYRAGDWYAVVRREHHAAAPGERA